MRTSKARNQEKSTPQHQGRDFGLNWVPLPSIGEAPTCQWALKFKMNWIGMELNQHWTSRWEEFCEYFVPRFNSLRSAPGSRNPRSARSSLTCQTWFISHRTQLFLSHLHWYALLRCQDILQGKVIGVITTAHPCHAMICKKTYSTSRC